MPGFVHLHTHSDYSILDGAQRIPKLVQQARDFGMPALALTDHGNLFGAVEFYKTARQAGIQPVLGCEAYVAFASRHEKPRSPADYHHLVVLVRNETGYRNLMQLVSEGYLSGFHYKPRIDWDLLAQHADGLLVLSACLKGEIPQLLLADRFDDAVRRVREHQEVFGRDHYFLEMQKHGIELEEKVAAHLPALSHETGAPIVLTNDSHYLCDEHSEAHDVLLCIQTGKDLDDPRRLRFETNQVFFKDADAMLQLVPEHPEYLENTLRVADRCKLELQLGRFLLPNFPILQGFSSPEEYLESQARRGFRERYPEPTPDLEARLRYELSVIDSMGFAGYFLIVADFVRAARERHIAVGPGRGSAAGSLVCYCLGVTDVDPIEHGLLFERFLNPQRVSMPDIDIDFDERRGEVIEYVKEKYGRENVCQIITFGTMAARGVVRDVGRVLRLSYAETDRIAKKIPNVPGMTLSKALEAVPELQDMTRPEHPQHKLMSICQTLEGLVRHASIHAAGIVITPTELVNHVPLYRSAKDEITTQYDMTVLEDVGLLKMDFLGLRTLTVLNNAVRLIHESHGVDIDWRRIPLDDPQTYEFLREADTVGVFQLESSGMRDLLRKIAPDRFDDIAAINALFRPGPLKSGMVSDFIERKHGRKTSQYLHPVLEGILADTYGVILYQEQVMRIASELAGFTLGEADLLRKAMGKKKLDVMKAQHSKFVDGAVSRGVRGGVAEKIWEQIVHFAGYGFNKSHSVAYAVISVQTAYLKAHYPAEYLAASLTSEMNDTPRVVVLIDDCRRRGVDLLSPDVNSSFADFRVREGSVMLGLGAIKNVGLGAIEAVVRAREEGGPFRSLFDFCERVESRAWNRRMLESLIMAGAMDSLPGNRAQKMAGLDQAIERGQHTQGERARGQASLFGGAPELMGVEPPLPDEPDWDEATRLANEKQVLGFYLSGHPLESQKHLLRDLVTCTTVELQESDENAATVLAGAVVSRKVIADKKGKPMAFVKLEDFVGTAELLVFSSVWERYAALLEDDAVVVVCGRANAREEQQTKLLCEQVFTLDDAIGSLGRALHLAVDATSLTSAQLQRLRALLAGHPGRCEVRMRLPGERRELVMRARNTRVAPSRALLAELRTLLGAENVRLDCATSQPQPARPGPPPGPAPAAPTDAAAGAAGAAIDSEPPW
ncbi:MAG: DNA polymerase III subunit alpha [Candidatus Krumholzibacteriia bacterium]